VHRIERDTAIICGVLAAAALAIWPSRPLIAGGVVGGGVLVGFAYAVIRGFVGGVTRAFPAPGSRVPVPGFRRRRHLVKFFTRHAILAVAAYVMMARLRLDAFGMLVGASSLWLAVALEAARGAWSGRAASGRERELDKFPK
jgi:hypothetical protein